MGRRKRSSDNILNVLCFFAGFSFGILLIWPGILKLENQKCFINIIKDGTDGDISIGTILTIDPSYLIKINNAKSKYIKILLIGDQCFRK